MMIAIMVILVVKVIMVIIAMMVKHNHNDTIFVVTILIKSNQPTPAWRVERKGNAATGSTEKSRTLYPA